MLHINPEDFSSEKYNVPVRSRLALYLPIAGSRPEAMRVSERTAIDGGDKWFEVEIFSPRIERWIEQKSHATETEAVMDALGWYPQPVFAAITAFGFKLEQGGSGVESWRLERSGHFVCLTTADGSDAKDLDASADELSLGYYRTGQDHGDPIVEVTDSWDSIKDQVAFFATGDWVPPAAPLNTDRAVIETRALADYEHYRGRIVMVKAVSGYVGDNSVDLALEPAAKVRIGATSRESLLRWNDNWLDPSWEVELVEPHPQLANVRSMWIGGNCYHLNGKQTEASGILQLVTENGVETPDGLVEHPCSVPRWKVYEYADKSHSSLFYWKNADQISSDRGFETAALADQDAVNERLLLALEEMPEGATDFTDDGYRTVYYRRFNALNMNLLEQFDGKGWQVSTYLPWAALRSLSPAVEAPAPAKSKGMGL